VDGGTAVGILQQLTRTVPIVFVEVTDPVNRGLVASLAQPGGNTTGFTPYEFSIAGKWLELLKQIAPSVRRAAVIRDPSQSSAIGQFAAIQALAPSLGVEITPVDARDVSAIEHAMTVFAREANSGMIVTATGNARGHREAIIALAARLKLPAVYPHPYYVTDGGLASYGPNLTEQWQLAAGYVDRILKGEKAG
jgi:putative ABC transport system substrate-binding protein